MNPKDTSIDARDWLLLGLLSVLWGGSFFFNGVVLKEVPPFTLVFLRVALASLMLLPLLLVFRIRFPADLSGWRPFIAIGLFNNVLPFSLIVAGQTYIPSGLASILNATTPLFTVIVMASAGRRNRCSLASAADFATVAVEMISNTLPVTGIGPFGKRRLSWVPFEAIHRLGKMLGCPRVARPASPRASLAEGCSRQVSSITSASCGSAANAAWPAGVMRGPPIAWP